jgi:hypothetical protein
MHYETTPSRTTRENEAKRRRWSATSQMRLERRRRVEGRRVKSTLVVCDAESIVDGRRAMGMGEATNESKRFLGQKRREVTLRTSMILRLQAHQKYIALAHILCHYDDYTCLCSNRVEVGFARFFSVSNPKDESILSHRQSDR